MPAAENQQLRRNPVSRVNSYVTDWVNSLEPFVKNDDPYISVQNPRNEDVIKSDVDKLCEALGEFASHVNSLVSTVKSLRYDAHLQNPNVLRMMVQKLPDMLKLRWGEEVLGKNGAVNIEDFSKWLMQIANAACFVTTPRTHYVAKTVVRTPNFHNNRKPERTLVISPKEIKMIYLHEDESKMNPLEIDIPERTTDLNMEANVNQSVLATGHGASNVLLRMVNVVKPKDFIEQTNSVSIHETEAVPSNVTNGPYTATSAQVGKRDDATEQTDSVSTCQETAAEPRPSCSKIVIRPYPKDAPRKITGKKRENPVF
ncbi:hypothetical protein JTB14_036080 [Gonioctena quinquepunctata]|nr:hypothetical protein JTB14_036080 [Gonioctena quinquepunctata]